MKKIFRLLENVELMGLVFFANAILTYIFLQATNENELTVNIYFLSERFDYLVMAVIGYNLVSQKYHILVLPAIAILVMRFFNECLHVLNIVKINNFYLLSIEFFSILLCLWLTSRKYYSLS